LTARTLHRQQQHLSLLEAALNGAATWPAEGVEQLVLVHMLQARQGKAGKEKI